MRIVVTSFITLACLASLSSTVRSEETPGSLWADFAAHCVDCHGQDGTVEGKLNLLQLKSDGSFESRADILEKLVGVLNARRMPPADSEPLPAETRKRMLANLKRILVKSLKTYPFEPTPIRRMNRFQYNNAVVDLLELDRDIFALNERLLRRRDDYFRPETRKMPDQVRVSCRPLSKDIDNQRPEGFRGVASFPQDKRAEHGFDNRADHLTLSPLLMESFLTLSQTVVESPDLNAGECRSWDRLFARPGKTVRGPIEGRYEAEQGGPIKLVGVPKGRVWSQGMSGWGPHWSGNTQLIWMCREESLEMTLSFDAQGSGTGLRFGYTKAPDYGTFEIALDGKKIGDKVDLYDPKVVRAPDLDFGDLKIDAGPHTLKIKCSGKNEKSTSYLFGLDYIEVTGREPAPRTPVVDKSQVEIVRDRIQWLLRRAFRRPVDPATLDRFTQFSEGQLTSGASFEDTMRTVVGAVLGMPEFLYLYESTLDGSGNPGRQRVNDFELATRLAQFFWSSIPDDTLLDLAASGDLSEPETLSKQIDRMLDDRRAGRFCENFPAQWLQLERLVTSIPDREKFPYFYYHGYRTSMHMMSEPLLLFETVFVEDRSIMDLIAPDFTWQSDMLRSNYEGKSQGGHDVQVQNFKRVPLDDPRRGGVITNAAIMTMTSTPTRTQPITRGAWLITVIFNDPPPPPPADVPPLPEVDKAELEKLTIRERLAVHRKRADCAGCHDQIDPLGFALENYGPTGVWRDKYENGRDIDVSGTLFNEHEFTSGIEFKELLVQQKQRFIRGFVSHLLSYALGRELGPADSPALDAIAASATAGDDRMRALLKSVATSEPFLHKNVQTEDTEAASTASIDSGVSVE